VYKVLVGKLKEIDHLKDLSHRWRGWGCRVDPVGSGQVPVAGCCECGDEPTGSGATELVIVVKQ
jgi:hypothetical protein